MSEIKKPEESCQEAGVLSRLSLLSTSLLSTPHTFLGFEGDVEMVKAREARRLMKELQEAKKKEGLNELFEKLFRISKINNDE